MSRTQGCNDYTMKDGPHSKMVSGRWGTRKLFRVLTFSRVLWHLQTLQPSVVLQMMSSYKLPGPQTWHS